MIQPDAGAFLRAVATEPADEVLRWLAEFPDLVNATGPHPFWGGRPQALHVAIETKRRDVFRLLLESGADVCGNNGEYDHWSPLMIAIQRKTEEVRDELIRRGAPIGLPEALMLADDASVDRLLAAGALEAMRTVPNGGSILSFARTPFAIDRLVQLGAPTDLPDRWGTTPISSMSRLGPVAEPLVRRLIDHGAVASPEEYARLADDSALASLAECDPSAVTSDAVLIAAVEAGHAAIVRWLLDRGANVNARMAARSRHTALHAAAWNGDLPMVRLLVERGADTSALDEEYQSTPAQWARTAAEVRNDVKCQDVVRWLETL